MSKVQKRVPLNQIQLYLGKDEFLTIVLKTGATYFARITNRAGKEIVIRNAMNHIINIALDEIDEIWMERVV